MLCPVGCGPEDPAMNPVAVTAVRERVGDSLDDDGDIEGGMCIPSDIECDGFRTSAADALDGVAGKLSLENAVCEVMFNDIDRRFLAFRDAVGDDLCSIEMLSLSGIVGFCWYCASSSIDLSDMSSSGMPKSASVINALSRLLTGTIV